MELKRLFNVILMLAICSVKGEDYMVLFGAMEEKDASDPIKVAYSLSSSSPNEVTIRGPGLDSEDRTTEANQLTLESLGKDIIPDSGKENSKNVLLSTKGPMHVFTHLYTAKQGQGTLMAVHDLGSDSEEFVLTSANPRNNYKSQVTIAARENTNIEILDSGFRQIESQSLRANQIYTYKTSADITGYKVTADKPVGVISGTACSDLSSKSPPECDPIGAYIPPVDRLGELHIVPQIAGKSSDSDPVTIRVVAVADATKVRTFDPLSGSVVDRRDLEAGQYYDIEESSNKPIFLECSKGCLVSMLMKPFRPIAPYPGSPGGMVSGPLLTLVPDLWKAKTDMIFHMPQFSDAVLYSLTIVTTKKSRDSLRLDDKALTVTWSDIDAMPLNSSGTVTLDPQAGTYRLNSVNNTVPFIAYLFIHGPKSSYGGSLASYHSGGILGLFTPSTTEQPRKTPSTASDRPSFTLAPDPDKPSTPTTTVSTTPEGPKTTPTPETKTVAKPHEDYDIDYQDSPDQPIYTRRPRPSTTTELPKANNSATWKIAVIVVVFLLAIAAVVVIGFFLIRRSRARVKDKHNSYMGQAMAEFTPEGLVDSKVTMGEQRPQIDPKQGKNTLRGRFRDFREVIVSGLDTIRSKRQFTEA